MRNHLKLISVLVLAAAGFSAAAEPSPAAYRVIVNSKNPTQNLKRETVGAFFLKKITTWEGGGVVAPVDQGEDTGARKAFTQVVLKKSMAAVKAYWQQRVFSGRDSPPTVKGSDEEVVAFVKINEHAIGYVSPEADVAGVKVVVLTE